MLFYNQLKSILGSIAERVAKGDNLRVGVNGISIENTKPIDPVDERKKAENEFKSVNKQDSGTNVPVIEKSEFIKKYFQLEKKFFDKLMEFYYPEFKVLSNRSLDVFEYDIILESSVPQQSDYLFEIKYFPKRYNRYVMQEAIVRLGLSTKHYINKTKRFAKPVMVVVTNSGDFTDSDFKNLKDFAQTTLDTVDGFGILSTTFDELDVLTKDKIADLLNAHA